FFFQAEDGIRDFHVTGVQTCALPISVNTDLGVKSVPEFMALVRDNPGKLNYSSSGIGGSPHVGGAIFEDIVGSKVVHVPYKGGRSEERRVGKERRARWTGCRRETGMR